MRVVGKHYNFSLWFCFFICFAFRAVVHQHTTACSDGPCRETLCKARVATSGREKGLACRRSILPEKTVGLSAQDQRMAGVYISIHLLHFSSSFFPVLPFGILHLGLQKVLCPENGRHISPFKNAREAQEKDCTFSTRSPLFKPALHSTVTSVLGGGGGWK